MAMHAAHDTAGDGQAIRDVPVLYSFRRCPYAMRARLALAISQITCALREVKLSAKPQALLSASPKGTVPVLVLPDGTVIDESLDVMRWALGRNDPEAWLRGVDTGLLALNDGPFKHDLDRYKYSERFGSDPAEHRARGLAFLHELDQRLMHSRQLCGPVRGLADAAIMPFVRQFAAVDRAWFEACAPGRVVQWLAGHVASPLFQAVMTKRSPWSPEGAEVLTDYAGIGRPR